MLEIETLQDPAAIAVRAADIFMADAVAAIRSRGSFSVALSGGSTPLGQYGMLTHEPYLGKIYWPKCFLFWGDERCVPPNDTDSNYLRAMVTLISKIPIPIGNIHRIHGELPAEQAAAAYESELRSHFGSLPIFDLILLGIGPDGHTASLFPGTSALEEKEKWVVSVPHSTPPPPLVDRVSLTLPVIDAARHVVFLAAGAEKAEIVARIFSKDRSEPLLPAQRVDPHPGKLTWLLDQSAASRLS